MEIVAMELELPSCKHLCYHKFILPELVNKGYTQVVSFNAFFCSLKKRNQTKTRLYVSKYPDDWEMFTKVIAGHSGIDPTTPYKTHSNLWDFYKNIGYDHKTKKWTKR